MNAAPQPIRRLKTNLVIRLIPVAGLPQRKVESNARGVASG